MKLSHIGIAVKNIEERLKIWRDVFGLRLGRIEEVPDQKVKVAVLPLQDVNIELLEPLGEDSTISRFIERRGEGLHHICIEVDNVEKLAAEMKLANMKLIDEIPRIGAGGKKIVFIHPKDSGGVLIELTEK